MKTDHIKSVALVTEASKMWGFFEHPEQDCWIVAFEVSEEFSRGFIRYMRSIGAECHYEQGVENEYFEMDLDALALFEHGGAHWTVSLDGKTITRSCEYEDLYEKAVPDDWWMECVGVMKGALKTV